MYLAHFGLAQAPFATTPDTRFLYLSRRHEEALAALLYGISERKGFIVVTGEIGTGKTTLCRALWNVLVGRLDVPGLPVAPPTRTRLAVILNPLLDADELLRAIAEDLGLEVPAGATRKTVLDLLDGVLIEEAETGGNVVVLIDEAQNLPVPALEAVRLLSNLETEREKLLQIVLVGQPELDATLRRPDIAQLRSRIVVRYHLGPMAVGETEGYVRHRLRIAGNENAVAFAPGALERLHDYTRGTPRLVNILCDKLLLSAFASGGRAVDAAMVDRAIREHEGGVEPEAAPRVRPPAVRTAAASPAARTRRPAAEAAAGAAAVLLVIAATWGLVRGSPMSPPPAAAPAPVAVEAPPPPPPRVGWDADGVYRVEAPEATEAAAMAAAAMRWGVSSDSLAAAMAAHSDSPAAFARAVGLSLVRLDGDLAALLRVDLPVVLPVRHVGGGVVRVALLSTESGVYRFADPLLGRVDVAQAAFEAVPWRIRGGMVLAPPGAPEAADSLAAWVRTGGDTLPRLAAHLDAAGRAP